MTLAVIHAIYMLIGVCGWVLLDFVQQPSFFNAPKPRPTPFPNVGFLTPGILFVVGVSFALMGWMALVKASTLARPDRRDRSTRSDELTEDAKRILGGS